MQRKNNKLSSFRKALFVPFLLTALAVIPSVKSTYEWLELKTLDILFTYYPEICEITGQKQILLDNPAVVITKDQSFQSKFGHSPTRKDFAQLLNNLKKQGVKTAAFDFIYDEPGNQEDDEELINQLSTFPYPILAQHFVNRGQQNFSLIDINDNNAERPTLPTELYKPISEKAAAKGLINMPADLDSTIRYAPLAFHPADSDRFLPSLGFSAWINALLCKQENLISKIDLSKAANLHEAFDLINKEAPFNFISVGHDGLDRCIAEQEALHIFRYITKNFPNLKPQNNEISVETIIANAQIKPKTWVNLPSKALPIIGSYHTPCLRIPFKKLPAPFKGDGIETISMTRLVESAEEESSSFMFSKKQIAIDSEIGIQNITVSAPTSKSGPNGLIGQIKTVTGQPVINATIWAIMPQSGFWQKTTTDSNGNYKLSELPQGDFVISVYMPMENGWDKAMLSIEVTQSEQSLPLLMVADNSNNLKISADSIKNHLNDNLWIHGEVIPMLHSDTSGKCGATSIPEGYSLISLNDAEDAPEENFSLDGKGNLLLNEGISPNQIAAVLPDDDSWQLHFYRKIRLAEEKETLIPNLPTSLDSIITLANSETENLQNAQQEIIIKPGIPANLDNLPTAVKNTEKEIRLSVNFSDLENDTEAKLVLLSEEGREFTLKNGETLAVPSGSYFALTESKEGKGLYQSRLVNHDTVFIGTSLPSDQDFVITPINFLDMSFNKIAGVHIHANLFSALMKQNFLQPVFWHSDSSPNAWPFLQFLMVAPIFFLLSIRFGKSDTMKSLLIVMAIICVLVISAVYMFPKGKIMPIFFPSMLIMCFSVTRGFVEWINSRRQAIETQNAFSRFISADVVNQIVNNPDAIKPGGEKKELTIIFTDIAGFTSISEKLEPEALTDLMNDYLNEMTNLLFKHGGTLDKYIGDAIMGFWNHPTLQEDHATRAVICAIEMQKKLAEMREKWMAQGLPKVEVRAGINTGNCMVGFIGSKIQMNFTCLGDNVNLASRLEGANKAYGTFIMITEAVKQQLNPEQFSLRFLDFLAVKGKDQPVLVYEVRGFMSEEKEIWKEKAGKIYSNGIEKYLARQWDEAIDLFNQVLEIIPNDGPSKVYIERCVLFKQTPPPEKWDGRFVLKTK